MLRAFALVLEGFGSLFDWRLRLPRARQKTAAEALAGDWVKVGGDIQRAMTREADNGR